MVHQELAHPGHAPTDDLAPMHEVWTHTFPQTFRVSQPTVGDGLVLVGLIGNDAGHFAALDARTGALRWMRQREPWWADGHPVAANGRVYLIEKEYGNTSELVCLAIADGSLQWRSVLPAGNGPGGDSHIAGLAASHGQVYCHLGSGKLRAYDGNTGTLNWEVVTAQKPDLPRSSPAVGFGNVYVGTEEGLKAFSINGAPRWLGGGAANGWASPVVVSEVPVGTPALVVIGAGDGALRARHATGGAQIWQYDGDTAVDGWAPALANGKLYLWQAGFRQIIEMHGSGGLLTRRSPDLGGRLVSAPTVTRNHVIAVLRTAPGEGRVVTLRLADLAIHSRLRIPEPRPGDEARAVVENGYAYVVATARNAAVPLSNTIYAFHRKSKLDVICAMLPDFIRRFICPA